ncbi:hypothetical protein AB0G86_34160 [Streptomyces scabiei]|uniref:hypothetical protein n=1 Tax=Streptomyces scabiei TaxID=1930 RepID=UPI0033FB1B1D
MLGQGWQSQWERVDRRLGTVQAVYTGTQGGTDVAIDAVLSFFETVHHLKDWLRNDEASGVTKDNVHTVIDGSPALQFCADLANGSKHFKLTTSQTGDFSTTIARNDVAVLVGTGTSAHRFYAVSGDEERDVLEIAEEAVATWRDFLSRRHLI